MTTDLKTMMTPALIGRLRGKGLEGMTPDERRELVTRMAHMLRDQAVTVERLLAELDRERATPSVRIELAESAKRVVRGSDGLISEILSVPSEPS